jgi:hypothetical protein
VTFSSFSLDCPTIPLSSCFCLCLVTEPARVTRPFPKHAHGVSSTPRPAGSVIFFLFILP